MLKPAIVKAPMYRPLICTRQRCSCAESGGIPDRAEAFIQAPDKNRRVKTGIRKELDSRGRPGFASPSFSRRARSGAAGCAIRRRLLITFECGINTTYRCNFCQRFLPLSCAGHTLFWRHECEARGGREARTWQQASAGDDWRLLCAAKFTQPPRPSLKLR